MRDTSENSRLHGLRWLTAGVFLLLAAVVMLVALFLVPTPVARLALAHIFPAHKPSLGSATLTPAGRLI
jgi:hypothetical protein